MDVIIPIKDYVAINEMETEIGFQFLTKHGHNYVFKKNDYYIYIEVTEKYSEVKEVKGQMIQQDNEETFMQPPTFYEQVINGIWGAKVSWRP